jgi:hypothetical protein
MTVREMMIERIMMCVTEDDLEEIYGVTETQALAMSDEDLFDLYDRVCEMC